MYRNAYILKEVAMALKGLTVVGLFVVCDLSLYADKPEMRVNTPVVGRLHAKYSVRTPAELEAFAEFSAREVYFEMVGGAITKLGYALPLELTGVSNYQSLSAYALEGAKTKLIASNGDTAECDGNVCHLYYKAVTIDVAQRDEALRKKFTNAVEFERRHHVAKIFSESLSAVIEITFLDE